MYINNCQGAIPVLPTCRYVQKTFSSTEGYIKLFYSDHGLDILLIHKRLNLEFIYNNTKEGKRTGVFNGISLSTDGSLLV